MRVFVRLSQLVAGRRNPRRVKPERDAHRRLVASIRAHGLLEPLVVRPMGESAARGYSIIAGNRRLSALREIHRGDGDPKIPCEVRDVDNLTADAMSLAENFAREGMHPLDEAESFAKLAREDAKGVDAIAAEFGVTERYVRQRMKLATLADVVKAAYREGDIDTATAEAFASVPEERQQEVWQETGGNPRHADHVRNIVANAWLDASHALFDPDTLPASAVSRDLFSQRVLIERSAFLQAQADGLAREREALIEDGWSEVVVGPQAEAQDRLWAMAEPEPVFDEQVTRKLARIHKRRRDLEALLEQKEDDDEVAHQRIERRLEELEAREQEMTADAPITYPEAIKAVGTVFLIIDPDGQIRREYRVPRQRPQAGMPASGEGRGSAPTPPVPTSDDLTEGQTATAFAHQALAVRRAVLHDSLTRKRLLVLMLHEKVRTDALAIRRDANCTTLHASKTEGFASVALDELRQRQAEVDPFLDVHFLSEDEAYKRLVAMPEERLDALIDMLVAETLSAHPAGTTPLIARLAQELHVDIRRCWRPDAAWLKGFQKIQLAHLVGELCGPVYVGTAERKKKSELIEMLDKLFANAAEGRIEDAPLAARVNAWLPVNLRDPADKMDAPADPPAVAA